MKYFETDEYFFLKGKESMKGKEKREIDRKL